MASEASAVLLSSEPTAISPPEYKTDASSEMGSPTADPQQLSKRPRLDIVDPLSKDLSEDDKETDVSSSGSEGEPTDLLDLERMGEEVRKLRRSELEDLVLTKIVESIVGHTEVGLLRGKVRELTRQKERMAVKFSVMQRNVAELVSGVNMVLEGGNAPTNDIKVKKVPHPVKFLRDVGLQVDVDNISRLKRNVCIMSTAKPVGGQGRGIKRERASTSAATPTTEESKVKREATAASKEPLEVVDLTEDDNESLAPPTAKVVAVIPSKAPVGGVLAAPANIVLPLMPEAPQVKHQTVMLNRRVPPKPILNVKQLPVGIHLSWNLPPGIGKIVKVDNYQLYVYQENVESSVTKQWTLVRNFKAVPTSMNCTLSKLQKGIRYYFIVRAVDMLGRAGPFSNIQVISLHVKVN